MFRYTSDQRFKAIHHPHSEDWILQIKYPQHRDSGIYECQISTTPHMSHFIHLSVIGEFWVDLFLTKADILCCAAKAMGSQTHFSMTSGKKDCEPIVNDVMSNTAELCLVITFHSLPFHLWSGEIYLCKISPKHKKILCWSRVFKFMTLALKLSLFPSSSFSPYSPYLFYASFLKNYIDDERFCSLIVE